MATQHRLRTKLGHSGALCNLLQKQPQELLWVIICEIHRCGNLWNHSMAPWNPWWNSQESLRNKPISPQDTLWLTVVGDSNKPPNVHWLTTYCLTTISLPYCQCSLVLILRWSSFDSRRTWIWSTSWGSWISSWEPDGESLPGNLRHRRPSVSARGKGGFSENDGPASSRKQKKTGGKFVLRRL